MSVIVREYTAGDIPAMTDIWNEVVDTGVAFPQMEMLSEREAATLFSGQSYTSVAVDEQSCEILGLYILHPNNIGRCGHISNASYAVKSTARGLGVGESLVTHSIKMGGELGFKLLQFNAVVRTNHAALHLYEKLGFVRLGVIPGGFLMKSGLYEDIVLFYREL